MNKEKISELLEKAINGLIETNVLIYPEGSLPRDKRNNFNKCGYIEVSTFKPEFLDIQDYRDSLLKLISRLIVFYKEV